jgi:hypothetical protein
MTKVCDECDGKGYVVSHGAFGEPETYRCRRCINIQDAISQAVRVIDKVPLGYRTEEEHVMLESFAKRIVDHIKREVK